MRKLTVLLGLLAAGWGLAPPTPAQEAVGGVIPSRYRHFRIPFQTGQGPKPLKQLNLFVSTDQGRSWHPSATASPDQGHFRFLTERDGLFWFAVQTVDQDGRGFPVTMDGVQPSLKVLVDTLPPQIALQPLPPRAGEVGVAWDIRDDNPEPASADSFRLEYRPAGMQWLVLPVNPGVQQYYWNPQSGGVVEVRLRARDRAGNWGEAITSVSLSGTAAAAPPPTPPVGPTPDPFGGPAPGEERRMVSSKRITLNYDLQDVGPSGVSAVELWYTQDGRGWNKYPPRAGEEPGQKSMIFEVPGEGLYGVTLVAKSGVGLSVRPPQLGDRPQMWIEVDMTKPVVQLYNVIVGQGEDKGKLTVTWSARDKNLAREPISLLYAQQAAGPWLPMAKGLANTGRFVWVMPPKDVPYQFYVKVEAVDLAGNAGEAVTDQMVKVDLSHPRTRILNVGPAGGP